MHFPQPRRPAHGTVAAYVALFVALGGTSYAAVSLAPNSVGSKQLRANSVTGSKVRNHTLTAADFRVGQLPQGAEGPTGPTGPRGPAGPAGTPGAVRAYGRVDHDGTLSRSSGATAKRIDPGSYCVTPTAESGIDVSTTGIIATIDTSGTSGNNVDTDQVAHWNRAGNSRCPANSLVVETYQNDSSNQTALGGGGSAPRFTHRPADDAFFFVIP